MPTTISGTTGVSQIQDGTVATADIADDAITDVKIAAVAATKLTGTIADARFPATLPAASGANLTSIPAGNLTGTVADARIPATLPARSGVNLTALNASNIGSGTVPTARLGSGTASSSTFLRGDGSWQAVSIPLLDSPSITGTLFVDSGSTVSHTISNWSDDISYTITPTNCTVGSVNSSGVFVITHTSGAPSYTILATTASLGLDDSTLVTKNIALSEAMTAPSLNAPADSDDATAVTYTISSIDANATKVIFDAQSSYFTYGSVGSGTGSKVGNTVEITGWSSTSVTVTLTYTTAATYSNRAKVQSTNAAYTDSAYSSIDSIIISASATHRGTKGFFCGGYSNSGVPWNTDDITYITISSTGNSAGYGDLSEPRAYSVGCSSGDSSRGLIMNGYHYDDGVTNPRAQTQNIEYINLASQGSATSFGNTTELANNSGATSDGVRGVRFGGEHPSTSTNTMDYVTIATTGNATDFGNLMSTNTGRPGGTSNDVRGLVVGGRDASNKTDSIHYFTIQTTGNVSDFGNLSQAMAGVGVASGTNDRAVTAGGNIIASGNVNELQYVTISTTGNASDFGDLIQTPYYKEGVSNGTRGCYAGGITNDQTNVIEYITFSTLGNATDFGDVTNGNNYPNYGPYREGASFSGE